MLGYTVKLKQPPVRLVFFNKCLGVMMDSDFNEVMGAGMSLVLVLCVSFMSALLFLEAVHDSAWFE